MSIKNEEHLLKETLEVTEIVPGHGERESEIFNKSRHQIIKVEKRPCYFCGAVDTHEAPLEAHHSPIEFSLANDVDFGPDAQIRKDFPAFDWKNFDLKGGDPFLFVDSVFNLVPVCRPCHTGKNRGIHAKPYPFVIIRRYVKKGVALTPEERNERAV